MQHSSDGMVEEVEQIHHVMTDVNDLVASIATGMDEQSVTTQDMARTVAQAAQVAEMIATDMAHVNAASTQMAAASTRVQEQAVALTATSQHQRDMVAQFTGKLLAVEVAR